MNLIRANSQNENIIVLKMGVFCIVLGYSI